MFKDLGFVKLSDILVPLAGALPQSQHALDQEYERSLRDFQPIVAFAQRAGLGELVREMIPAPLSIRSMDIQLSLAAGQSRSQSFEIGFRIINAGFQKSFQATQRVQHSLHIHIAAAPFPPGGPSDEVVESPPER